MTSSSPLMEIDYNMHKSNSTFFSDLDVSRTHLLVALFKPALAVGRLGGSLNIALGGTSCLFKKPIAPCQKYEVWSRVLAWDDKWLYIVSHFVRSGKIKPRSVAPSGMDVVGKLSFAPSDAVLASSISRYVFKDGRKTVNPESSIRQLKLIPDASHPENFVHSAGKKDEVWDEKRILREKDEGLKLARAFTSLEDLHGTLSGGSWPILESF
jgi:hypothetical protein